MDSLELKNQLHFVLIPLMSPGHIIPMIDMAKLLAQHGVFVTIVTTPLNSIRFCSVIERAVENGLKIQLLPLKFPALEAGLPEGCENMDKLTERSLIKNFFTAASLLQKPFEDSLENLQPPVSCLISGKNLGWTVETCKKFKIPRIFFDGMGCFSSTCTNILETSKILEGVSKSEPILVPGLPHRITLTRAQLPENLNTVSNDMTEVRNAMRAAESAADGTVVNTFHGLESEYVEPYKKLKAVNAWCVGPVSSCNNTELDRAERGERISSIDAKRCLDFLDSKQPGSVIYACLGSICGLNPWQLRELGLGLEASNKPFIWVVRERSNTDWISDEGFEERTRERGLVIHGWAPQVLILCHVAIGGFVTHCGWNSTLEGIGAGVPLVTCPLFAEQFINERLVIDVLGIGVSVEVEEAVTWGFEDKAGLVMRREGVRDAIVRVLEEGGEAEERRRKARELGLMAKKAVDEGGSSFVDMKRMILFVKNWTP